MLWSNVFNKDKTVSQISNVTAMIIDYNYATTNLGLANFVVMDLEELVERTKSQSWSSKQ